jgi:hypothetical protein
MPRYTAVLDACVLVPIALADTLLGFADQILRLMATPLAACEKTLVLPWLLLPLTWAATTVFAVTMQRICAVPTDDAYCDAAGAAQTRSISSASVFARATSAESRGSDISRSRRARGDTVVEHVPELCPAGSEQRDDRRLRLRRKPADQPDGNLRDSALLLSCRW